MYRFNTIRSAGKITGYILITILLLVLLYSEYLPVTLGFDWEDLSVFVLPGFISFFSLQYILGPNLLSRAYIPALSIFGLWALTYPLLFQASYTKPFYFYQFAPDYLFAIVLCILFILLPYLTFKLSRHHKIISTFWAILSVATLGIPLAQLGYFLHVNHCITPATLMALYMSNPQESYEYVFNAVGLSGIALALMGIVAIIYGFYRCYRLFLPTIQPYVGPPKKAALCSVLSLILCAYSAWLIPHVNIFSDWFGVCEYLQQQQQYKTSHKDIFNSVVLDNPDAVAHSKTPGTIIVVIGESASRTYMQVYNPNAPYPDTPWELKERQTNPNFIFFDHAYSAYVQTVPVLERALTERNQYEDRPFLDSASILDIAKKAGYHTYWFSNQGIYGEYDTAISLIAKTADTSRWAHESFGFSDKYDGSILPLLKEVNPNENNFVVIHLMGSHIYYNDRYPSEFSRYKKGAYPTGMEAYCNSLLYTDHILEEIYNYGEKHWNLQAMIYFSDHGESLISSHNPDIFDFDMTRIPFWIYLSPTYQKAYPTIYTTLRSHENQYFTNDLLYDLISGILQAPSNRYDAKRDFSNPNYQFTRNTLTTMLGTHPLSEDIHEE